MNSFHPRSPELLDGPDFPPYTRENRPNRVRVAPTHDGGGAMAERWFTDEELREMSRPTMDRAIEALDRGDVEAARALCEAMKYEWRSLHDLMVEGVAGLISFGRSALGDDGVARAWRYGSGRGWQR